MHMSNLSRHGLYIHVQSSSRKMAKRMKLDEVVDETDSEAVQCTVSTDTPMKWFISASSVHCHVLLHSKQSIILA